jgi:Ala-tRNA(Pro) deacylase
MSVSSRIENYLSAARVNYQLISHRHTDSALNSAHSAHVPEKKVVKCVLLHNCLNDNYSMALLPACNKLNTDWLLSYEQDLELASESDIAPQFPDCDIGAVPGFGQPFFMDMVWDEALMEADSLYFEGGDHESLLEIDHDDFVRLFERFPHSTISVS